MKLIVISGLSGSGKSIALQALEDTDYFCVDNLPISLLLDFTLKMNNSQLNRGMPDIAVGIDSRNDEEDLLGFRKVMEAIRRYDIDTEIIFLEANDTVLLQRFSETRRKHPLTRRDNLPLVEAISVERKLLMPIAIDADLHIDTSRTNVHQLRALISDRVALHAVMALSIQFVSFGFKHGAPEDADFVFDVRCLPNPHWDPRLRLLNGMDAEVIDFLQGESMVGSMFEDIRGFLEKWIVPFKENNRSYITIALGCTGGQHRSVYLVERLAAYFKNHNDQVLIRHRELVS